jgi:UDP-N-acetylglucosamine 2-epimerase (non-hydrolysing)
MIDTLVRMLPEADRRLPADLPARYALVTLHRPSNVDDLDWLRSLLSSLESVGHGLEVIFPVHPRTRQKISSLGIGLEKSGRIRFLEPLPYLDFLALQKHAAVVITDSGGIQEETTVLGIPCLTMRETTERPITVTEGTNVVVGMNSERIAREEAARVDAERAEAQRASFGMDMPPKIAKCRRQGTIYNRVACPPQFHDFFVPKLLPLSGRVCSFGWRELGRTRKSASESKYLFRA